MFPGSVLTVRKLLQETLYYCRQESARAGKDGRLEKIERRRGAFQRARGEVAQKGLFA